MSLRPSLETDETGLQCCVNGCRRRWSNEYGHGRLCSMHDVDRRADRRAERAAEKSQTAIPDLPPVRRHWQEETDDEPLPF